MNKFPNERARIVKRAAHPGWATVLMLVLPPLGLVGEAVAAEVNLKLEPAVAIPLTQPQSDLFDVGGGETLKLLFGLSPAFDIGPTASLHILPVADAAAATIETGVQWGFGGGLRLKRPHDAPGAGVSPWLDADALYVRTGPLNRPGFDVGAGLAFSMGEERRYWLGPFARYLQIVQPVRDGFDNRDAKLLTLGLSLEVGKGTPKEVPVIIPAAVEPTVVIQEVYSCPDRDKDGVPDTVDRCPDVVGTVELLGCPYYEKVVVKKDKIELKEKVYFAWDEARIEAVSFPLLADVSKAMSDNPSLRVRIEGHTDSSGKDAYNQDLSDRRAAAVRDYVIAQGVAADRLVSQGFGESVPVGSNKTVQGREDNRRVEFVITTNISTEGSAP